MTNLIATIVIHLTLSTNWTGHINGTNELGYVLTNHVAVVTYEGQKREFTLKSVPSDRAVWRVLTYPTNFYNHNWSILTNGTIILN